MKGKDQIVILSDLFTAENPVYRYMVKDELYVRLLPYSSFLAEKIKATNPMVLVVEFTEANEELLESVRILRSLPDYASVKILFLSSISDEYFILASYEAGINDYILLPSKSRLIYLKIKNNLIAHCNYVAQVSSKGNGFLEVNREKFLVKKHGKEYFLSRKEFELLELLLNKPGKVFTRKEISENLWNGVDVNLSRTIDVHVRKIRNKLGFEVIKTVKGVGYSAEI